MNGRPGATWAAGGKPGREFRPNFRRNYPFAFSRRQSTFGAPVRARGREATGLAGLRAHSLEQQWMSHDRSRTLFDQRSAGAARGHLAKFYLRASALGQPSERGPGLPAVHCRDSNCGAHRKLDDEGEPIQGLCPVAHVGSEDPTLLFVARRRQQIPSGQAAWEHGTRSCPPSKEAVDWVPMAHVTTLRNSR
jgi:hypothetical protein